MVTIIIGMVIGLTFGYFKYIHPEIKNKTIQAPAEVSPDEESRLSKQAYDATYHATASNMRAETVEQARNYAAKVKSTGERESDAAAQQINRLYIRLYEGSPDHNGYRAAVKRAASAKAMIDCANDIEAESYGIRRIK